MAISVFKTGGRPTFRTEDVSQTISINRYSWGYHDIALPEGTVGIANVAGGGTWGVLNPRIEDGYFKCGVWVGDTYGAQSTVIVTAVICDNLV